MPDCKKGQKKCVKNFIFILAVWLLGRATMIGQVVSAPQIGLNDASTYQHSDIDSVNLSNGNVYVHIPLLSYPQLGDKLKLNFIIRFNQPQWSISANSTYSSQTGEPSYQGIWGLNGTSVNQPLPAPVGVDVVRDQGITLQTDNEQFMCIATDLSGPADCASGMISDIGGSVVSGSGPYVYKIYTLLRDRTGSSRFVDNGTEWMGSATAPPGTSAYAADGSGWIAKNYGSTYVDRDGNNYSTKTITTVGGVPFIGHDITDVYGHTIITSANGWTDTVGRIVPGSYDGYGTGYEDDPAVGVQTSDLSKCDSGTNGAREWDVPWFNNGKATYMLCYTNKTTSTAFNTSVLNNYSATIAEAIPVTISMLTQIVLPDGNSYRFTYDNYLELTSISLPDGGSITYIWTTIPWDANSTSNPAARSIASRSVTSAKGTTFTTNYSWLISPSAFRTPGQVST